MTYERLTELLECDTGTGEFKWKVRCQGRKFGWFGGYLQSDGYQQITIDGKRYLAHRLMWLYTHKEFPKNQLDHINRIKSDNRIINLREVTASENRQNTEKKRNNKSGYKGVYWDKRVRKWRSQIRVLDERVHIGYFDDPKDGHDAYVTYCAKMHKSEIFQSLYKNH